MSSREAIARSDEALLAQLGYKQEFKRAFTPLEVRLLRLSQAPVDSRDSFALVGARRCSGCPSALLASCRPLRMSHPFYHRIKQTCTALFWSTPCRMVARLLWCGGYVSHRGAFWRVEMLMLKLPQWLVASLFILCVGLAMAELGSSAPTSGGVSVLL